MAQQNQSPTMQKLVQYHPLQRLPSPSIGISAFVHFIGVASFGSSFKFLVDHPNRASDAYGGHFTYLTILGLTLATFTFSLGSLADVTGSPRLFLLKNLLSIVSAPLAVVVSVLYWTLRTISPALVRPPGMSLPAFHDVAFHLTPSVLLVVDLLFLSPPWTITTLPTIGLGGVLAFGYWFWIEWCYSKNGWYPYPIFELATREQRIGLFTISAMIFTGSAISLRWLYGRVNGYGAGGLEKAKARPGKVRA